MGSDGEPCYENPASMSWTSSLVARGQREEGNGYSKPKTKKQRKTTVVREGLHGQLQLLRGEFCEDAVLKIHGVKIKNYSFVFSRDPPTF